MTDHLTNARLALSDFSRLRDICSSESTSEMCAWSMVRRSEREEDEQRTKVTPDGLTIGRRFGNDLCLSNPTVSGHHARVFALGDQLFLEDVGSTNGTLLNGRRVTSVESLNDGDVAQFGQVGFVIRRTELQSTAAEDRTTETFVAFVPDDTVLYEGFDRLLNRPDIDPYFQPVVSLGNTDVIGYESLVRSSVHGLETPDKIFPIAALRASEIRLSEVCRSEGVLSGIQLDPHSRYFLNTHPAELETPRLLESLRELRSDFPSMGIVLEIHEAAITSIRYLTELAALLNDLNIDLAYDDFGAGQARLVELFQVPPRYLKFDISFVRGLEDASVPHKTSIRALLNMVHDLNVTALAEGVETQAQADICADLGFDMAQGYFFGRPQPPQFWLDAEYAPGANKRLPLPHA
ncbi:MAG: EAL domain-containing protein [Fuerstiella sp.]|nr:EAL domain-containing protein [Fuerstiella sp.]